MNEMFLLRLDGWPILRQLQLEEALLRTDTGNWCLLNQGSPPAIVLGISSKYEQHINHHLIQNNPVPVIRRFSGGGSVFIDPDTLFVTTICNHPNLSCCPKEVLRWNATLYQEVLDGHPFYLKENDFALGERKFGGNAQYLTKKRWLHHSSLLWDFDQQNMNYLSLPPSMPSYRQNRTHKDFLCRLRDYLPSKQAFQDRLLACLHKRFHLIDKSETSFSEILERPHRKGTVLIEKNC